MPQEAISKDEREALESYVAILEEMHSTVQEMITTTGKMGGCLENMLHEEQEDLAAIERIFPLIDELKEIEEKRTK